MSSTHLTSRRTSALVRTRDRQRTNAHHEIDPGDFGTLRRGIEKDRAGLLGAVRRQEQIGLQGHIVDSDSDAGAGAGEPTGRDLAVQGVGAVGYTLSIPSG